MGNASFLTCFLETEIHFSKSCLISAIGLTKYIPYIRKSPLGDPLIILPSIIRIHLFQAVEWYIVYQDVSMYRIAKLFAFFNVDTHCPINKITYQLTLK